MKVFGMGAAEMGVMAMVLAVPLLITVLVIVLLVLGIKALRKHLHSKPDHAEEKGEAKSLGETLRERRTSCGMTQEVVAETLGVSRQAVSKWESGRADPSTSNLIALARLYETSVDELLRSRESRDDRPNANDA